MFHVRCFTNLDDYRTVEWPKKFSVPPRVGDRVRGLKGSQFPELRIVAIMHCESDAGPWLRVELHN